MCKASHAAGGPLRCSGDARTALGRSQQAVQALQDHSADLRRRLEPDDKARRIIELEEADPGHEDPGEDPDKAHELWLETRYSEEIAAEEAAERARGAVDFEDAWDAADPAHAAARPLRHAERQAYEEVLAEAMRHGYNQSYGDRLDEEAIDRRAEEILAEQGLTRAVIEARIAAATAQSA